MGKVEMERSTGLPFLSNMICGLDMNGQRSGKQLGEETEHALPVLPHLSTLVKGSGLYPKNSQTSGWLLSKGMAIPSEKLYFEEYMTSARANISSEYVHIIYHYSLSAYSVSPLSLPTRLSS